MDAHRAFIASDSRFRPGAVRPACFLAAGFGWPFFAAAQRLLVAAIIAARPSGDKTRFPEQIIGRGFVNIEPHATLAGVAEAKAFPQRTMNMPVEELATDDHAVEEALVLC